MKRNPPPRLIKKCLKERFLPVSLELATFVMHALSPALSDRDAVKAGARAGFDAEGLACYREGEQKFRRDLIESVVEKMSAGDSPVEFFYALEKELTALYANTSARE